ncbi:MAG: N-acetylmuramoyl-L-alanine amidase family protein [Ignavibacteria bacterium]
MLCITIQALAQTYTTNFSKLDVIVIDAGHGGKDPGTIGISDTREKDIVLAIANKLKQIISNNYKDIKIVMTRETDEFIELKERGIIANSNNGKLFISIHCNARKNVENDKSGFEIYVLDPQKKDDATTIAIEQSPFIKTINYPKFPEIGTIIGSLFQSSFSVYATRFATILNSILSRDTPLESRGILQQEFYVLYGASMPSVLVECGYLSNKNDEAYLKSEKGQSEIAYSIYKALRYYKMDYEFENK